MKVFKDMFDHRCFLYDDTNIDMSIEKPYHLATGELVQIFSCIYKIAS